MAWKGIRLGNNVSLGEEPPSGVAVACIRIGFLMFNDNRGGKMKLRALVLCGILVVLVTISGCAPNAVVNPTPAKQMDEQARVYSQGEYVIAAGDVLDIKFLYNPDFNELGLPVRPDGRISLQLAPDVMAAGLTPSQLRDTLSQQYGAELKKPEAAVIVRSFGSKKILVDGEVAGPRLIDFVMPTTVMRAIAQAGGLRETARMSNVIVIRKDSDGKPAGTMVDLRKVIDGTDFGQDISLMPYDIVYVPKSNIARVDKFVDEYVNRVIPGLGSLNPYTYMYTTSSSVR
jgi:polysaccharide biosynthesis/export protein